MLIAGAYVAGVAAILGATAYEAHRLRRHISTTVRAEVIRMMPIALSWPALAALYPICYVVLRVLAPFTGWEPPAWAAQRRKWLP